MTHSQEKEIKNEAIRNIRVSLFAELEELKHQESILQRKILKVKTKLRILSKKRG